MSSDHYGTNRLAGCSHGWLATLDKQQRTIALVNPFETSVALILLPNLDKQSYDIRKVILSADPALNPNSCVVVAMFHHTKLVLMKLRGGHAGGSGGEQQRWSCIPIISLSCNILRSILSLDVSSSNSCSSLKTVSTFLHLSPHEWNQRLGSGDLRPMS